MQLAYFDRGAPHKVYALPRRKGESRTDYAARFFREVHGLGNVMLCTVRGQRVTRRSNRISNWESVPA